MSEITDMTKEELILELFEGYQKLEEKYKDLKEKYEDLTQEESEPQYDYEAYNEGFAKGEQSMQEKVVKICEYWDFGFNDLVKLFEDLSFMEIFKNVEGTYNKIMEYEKKKEQEEIHVGDEVLYEDGNKYVVYCLTYGYIYALKYDGTGGVFKRSDISKTGKHYCLDEILKELE